MPKLRVSLVGQRFGKVVVTKYLGSDSHRNGVYRCVCDCGKETDVYTNSLKRGHTKSCGCSRHETLTTHGMSENMTASSEEMSTYKSWKAMLARCYNTNDGNYHRYGGRGITVCDKWRKFEGFLEDMGVKPRGLTIERLDVDKGYYKENCEWATYLTQNRNKTNTVWVMYKGRRLSLAEACELTGVKLGTAHQRIRRGWSPEEAIS